MRRRDLYLSGGYKKYSDNIKRVREKDGIGREDGSNG
jgi:hypothetical protein